MTGEWIRVHYCWSPNSWANSCEVFFTAAQNQVGQLLNEIGTTPIARMLRKWLPPTMPTCHQLWTTLMGPYLLVLGAVLCKANIVNQPLAYHWHIIGISLPYHCYGLQKNILNKHMFTVYCLLSTILSGPIAGGAMDGPGCRGFLWHTARSSLVSYLGSTNSCWGCFAGKGWRWVMMGGC